MTSRRLKTRRRLRLAMAALAFMAAAFVLVGLLRPHWILEAEFARQRLLAGASVHALRVGDHRVVYLEAGRGPRIVLLHGFTGAKENWLPLMRRLSGKYRVIAPDLPGWGESTRLRGADYGPVAQAERVRDLLAALDGRGVRVGGLVVHPTARLPARPPALVVGHSMGGQILGLLAARHPDAVGPIVLMNSAGVPFEANDFGRAVLAGKNPFEVRTRADVHRYLGIVFTDPPWVPWPVDVAIARQRSRQVAFEQSVLDGIGRGSEALELHNRLGRIQSPVLLLWCRDDRVIDVSAVEAFRAGLRDSRAVLLNDCGHMPMMAKPEVVAAALDAFARRKVRRPRSPSFAAAEHSTSSKGTQWH